MKAERTITTFQSSSFNVKEAKDYFMNQDNFGDDLARWLSEQLEKRNIRIKRDDEFPGQEDFGWFFNCQIDGDDYCIVVGHHFDSQTFEWVTWIERKCGLIKSLFGGRKKDIDFRVPQTIHEVLSSSDTISHIRWHRQIDFDQGRLTEATAVP